MDKKTINEVEVFEINPNYYVAIEYFGKQKVKERKWMKMDSFSRIL